MKEVTGVLKMLGSSVVTTTAIGKSFVRYDTIEIGDAILQKVGTARSLKDFVERGLGQNVTLYLNGNRLIGVKLSDGKIYYWKRGIGIVVFVALGGVIFGSMFAGGSIFWIPAIGVMWALLSLFFRADLKQVLSYQSKLSSLGGTPLKS